MRIGTPHSYDVRRLFGHIRGGDFIVVRPSEVSPVISTEDESECDGSDSSGRESYSLIEMVLNDHCCTVPPLITSQTVGAEGCTRNGVPWQSSLGLSISHRWTVPYWV